MKPRTLKSYKILAVALTTAGCSSASGGEIAAKPATGANGPVAAEVQAVSPSPVSATSQDPALLALRQELSEKNRDEVLAQPARFQPLCDKDGYPLVGNLMRKTATPSYEPSAFCTDLHAQARR
jgi:hypothetical protein